MVGITDGIVMRPPELALLRDDIFVLLKENEGRVRKITRSLVQFMELVPPETVYFVLDRIFLTTLNKTADGEEGRSEQTGYLVCR